MKINIAVFFLILNIITIGLAQDTYQFTGTASNLFLRLGTNARVSGLAESFTGGKGISWGIVEKENRRFIGYFGFWRIIAEHCRAEIGFALDPDFWGCGYMTETIRTLVSFGFS